MKKVLIAAPIGDGKEYSINEWFNWIAMQTYTNFDVALCVNGKSQESLDNKIYLLHQVEISGRPLIVLKLDYNKYHTTKHRLSYSREIIRKYAIEKDYDYVLWLDTDTIPFILNSIELLMNQEKEVISGLYFYKGTKQSVIIDDKTQTNVSFERIQELVESGEVIKVWGFGFGCVLMARSVFDKFSFDYRHKFEDWSEDFIACDLIKKSGIDRWFYARVICKHYHKKDFGEISQQETDNEGFDGKDKHIPTGEGSP